MTYSLLSTRVTGAGGLWGVHCSASQASKLLRAAMAQSVLVTCPGAGWTMMHLGRGPGARLASFYQAALHLPP
ncbi:hypothetical protein IG631_16067 [Alternaria alternata]|nr:hypothetical protein IG631_16067 [Alternaria alternata]